MPQKAILGLFALTFIVLAYSTADAYRTLNTFDVGKKFETIGLLKNPGRQLAAK
jgi:hypothetical protein